MSTTLVIIAGIILLGLFLISFFVPHEDRKSKAFGSAKFGTGLLKKNLHGFAPDGKRRISLQDSFRHVLLIAGSGGGGGSIGGKTTTFIIPSLIYFALEKKRKFQSSLIITDIKGELHPLLSGFLASKGYSIFVLDFISINESDQYNPFLHISSDQEYKDMALSLYDLSNSDKPSEGIWRQGASSIIYWIISLLAAIDDVYLNFANLLHLIHLIENENLMISLMDKYLPNSPIRKQYISFTQLDVKIRSSQLASAITALSPFDTSDVKILTAQNTINFENLRKRKSALFLKIPPGNSSSYSVLTLFYSQLFTYCLKTPIEKTDYPLMILGDEFGNLSRIGNDNFYSQVLTLIRSQKVGISMIIQSISQIITTYGSQQAKTILSGAATVIAYPGIRGADNINFIQGLLGKSTYSYFDDSTEKEQIVARSLMTVSEIREMKTGVVIPSSAKPNKIKLHPIYKNKRLLRKAKIYSKDGKLHPKILPHIPTNKISDRLIPFVTEYLENNYDLQNQDTERMESFMDRLEKLLPKK